MGCFYEINDTLVITKEQGFPSDIFNIEKHQKNPVTLKDVEGKIFHFKNKPAARAFQLDPVRVFFAERTENDKWLFWGKVYIESITITRAPGAPDNDRDSSISFKPEDWVTAGTFKVIQVYNPEYQRIFTNNEAPPAWNYFAPSSSPADQITYQSTFRLKRGTKPALFKKLAENLKKLAAKEQGTLHYNYYTNKKETIFSFIENYANSDAAIIHGNNNAKVVAKMLALSSVKLEVFGNASDALVDSLKGVKPTYFEYGGGIGR